MLCIIYVWMDLDGLGRRWCNEEDYESRSCHIPCASDCKMSQWSEWTPCNSTCGPGVRTRQRQVTAAIIVHF